MCFTNDVQVMFSVVVVLHDKCVQTNFIGEGSSALESSAIGLLQPGHQQWNTPLYYDSLIPR